ncbi:MAG: hypothetical protein KGK07_17575, partial [Chloroflexota bacterium]|nr:hypothetical protein [Chloroflexota bacterium]
GDRRMSDATPALTFRERAIAAAETDAAQRDAEAIYEWQRWLDELGIRDGEDGAKVRVFRAELPVGLLVYHQLRDDTHDARGLLFYPRCPTCGEGYYTDGERWVRALEDIGAVLCAIRSWPEPWECSSCKWAREDRERAAIQQRVARILDPAHYDANGDPLPAPERPPSRWRRLFGAG